MVPVVDRAADEAAIRAVLQRGPAAVNARDFDAFTASYAPDADAIALTSPKAVGPDAISAMMAAAWAQVPAERQISVTIDSIRFLTDDVAVVDASADFTTEPLHDRGTTILVRGDTGWQVAVFRVYPALAEP